MTAGVLSAQTPPPLSLEHSTDGATWSTANEMYELNDTIQFRVNGEQTEWIRLVTGAAASSQFLSNFAWLDERTETTGVLKRWQYRGAPDMPLGVHPKRLQYAIDIGRFTYGTVEDNTGAISDWYVPLLSSHGAGGPRRWIYDPDLWRPNFGAGNGGVSSQWWQNFSMSHITGDQYASSEFSPEAIFRWSVLLRAIETVSVHHSDPFDVTNQYLDSNEYRDALIAHDGAYLMLHALALRSDQQQPPGETDATAPRLDLPTAPLGRITTKIMLPIIAPKLDSTLFTPNNVYGLQGTFQPGQTRYWHALSLVPTVYVHFPTTTGTTRVRAKSAITRENPLRMSIVVPRDVKAGPVSLQINDSQMWNVGHVDQVLKR